MKNTYEILFTGFKRENYDVLQGNHEEIKENDDFILCEIFQKNVFSKLGSYELIKEGEVSKRFLEITERNTLSEKIQKLDQDLRELHLRKPFYTLETLEDIQGFRNLQFSQKKEKICNIFDAKEDSEFFNFIQTFNEEEFNLKLNFFYQGYKEELFSPSLIQECKLDETNLEKKNQLLTLFFMTLADSVALSLLRNNFLTMEQIFSFLSNERVVNFDPDHFSDEDFYMGTSRLDLIVKSEIFFNELKDQTIIFNDIMDESMGNLMIKYINIEPEAIINLNFQ